MDARLTALSPTQRVETLFTDFVGHPSLRRCVLPSRAPLLSVLPSVNRHVVGRANTAEHDEHAGRAGLGNHCEIFRLMDTTHKRPRAVHRCVDVSTHRVLLSAPCLCASLSYMSVSVALRRPLFSFVGDYPTRGVLKSSPYVHREVLWGHVLRAG